MNRNITAFLQLLTSVGLILFWTVFFTIGFENPTFPPCYLVFEHSFPLPDLFLCVLLLLAYAKRGKTQWHNYTLAAGGAMIFLGLCDFSFNMMNGMYTISLTDGLMNGVINLWCVVFGAWQLYAGWR